MRAGGQTRASDIPILRLRSQGIAHSNFESPQSTIGWMGAIQAQDFLMSRWAVGVRLPGSTERSVLAAVNEGSIIRTHLLRPTWHLAAAADVRWLLRLSAPQIRARMKFRDKQLGLTEPLYARADRVLEKALRDGAHCTREELIAGFRKARIAVDENRASHLFLRAELDGVICSGAFRGNKPTYASFDQRVPPSRPMAREEALAALALRYFASHGPATVEDFTWWSGLSARDARRAVQIVKGSFVSVGIDSRTYLAVDGRRAPSRGRQPVHLLPAYDEFLIGYADREAILGRVNEKNAISSNGLFRPIIVENGRVIGVWSRRAARGGAEIEAALFGSPGTALRAGIEASLARLEAFWGVKASLAYRVI